MNSEQKDTLNCERCPAVLTDVQVSHLTGFNVEEVSIISSGGILKPLGNPKANEKRLWALVVVEDFCRDVRKLTKARECIVAYWKRKNASRKQPRSNQHPGGFRTELRSPEQIPGSP